MFSCVPVLCVCVRVHGIVLCLYLQNCANAQARIYAGVCVYVCVCVCEREREREKERASTKRESQLRTYRIH